MSGYLKRSLFSLVCITALASCGGGGGGGTSGESTPAYSYRWTNLSPFGGFVSSVAFHPANRGEVWVSGDDASGIYRSTNNGTSWTLLTTPPADQSTYAIRFDAGNPAVIYAPNHFGRGLLESSNAGASWGFIGNGLPTGNQGKRFNDLAIDPTTSTTLYAALEGGLYKSTDGGTSFSPLNSASFGGEKDFRAVVVDNTRIVVGSATGRVYTSIDGGASWREITTTGFFAVSDLVLTANALYIAFDLGSITRTTTFNTGDFSVLNNSTLAGAIKSGAWTKLAAVSGASAATDTLYVGTVFDPTDNNWGFFESTNGGASFTKKVNGLSDESVFDIAVDPFDASRVVYATINGGVYLTDDAGNNWRNSSSGILATDSYGFAEDLADARHLLMSSTAGLEGTSKVFETVDDATSWAEVTSLDGIDLHRHEA
jgi:photosystem II stability/assembly factor-like uncharacterized protein